MSVNVALVPNQVTTGDDAPALETMQANMVVMKWPPPLVCHVAAPGAMTCFGVEQEAVSENVSTAVTESEFEEDFEVMTSRSPTETGAANVQEAVIADEWPVHAAPVYVIACAPAIGVANNTTAVISIFIGHNPVDVDLLRARTAANEVAKSIVRRSRSRDADGNRWPYL